MANYCVMQDRPSATKWSPIYGAIETRTVKLPSLDAAVLRARLWARKHQRPASVVQLSGSFPLVFVARPAA